MKKLGALLLVLCTMMCTMSLTFMSSAQEPATEDPLIVHYDFSGETIKEALSDKAAGGSVKDDLTPYFKAENAGSAVIEEAELDKYFVFDQEAGTVTLTESGAYLRDEKLDDIKTLNGTATFFFRFRLQKLPAKGKFTYLLDLRDKWGNGGRKFQSLLLRVNENGAVNLLYCDKVTEADASRNVVGQNTIEAGVYYNLAITMAPNADASATVVTTYLSTAMPSDAAMWSTASSVELPIDFSQMEARESSMAIFSYYYGQPESDCGVTMDDLRIYRAALTLEEIADIVKNSSFDASGFNVAYQTYGQFISFYQTNTNYLELDGGNAWKLKEAEGSLNGTSLWYESTAASEKGDGVTLTFWVPEDGDYYVWGRVFYASNTANSLFYAVDGGAEAIWDFPDEDGADSACYNSWQYVYMTERKAGTYSDTTKYGEWTIANQEWRHSPAVLHLAAGEHRIHFTGREAGMYIDELVVTSYSVEEYDPNAFEAFGDYQTNAKLLESCKFCGSEWRHYCSDIYAQTGVSAAKYFKTVSHPTAIAWTIPQPSKPEDPDKPEDPNPIPGDDDGDQTSEEPDEITEEPRNESTGTQEESTPADGNGNDKGCKSSLNSGCLWTVILVIGVCGLVIRKRIGGNVK